MKDSRRALITDEILVFMVVGYATESKLSR